MGDAADISGETLSFLPRISDCFSRIIIAIPAFGSSPAKRAIDDCFPPQ
jgi:hypothetical protein